MIFLMFSFVKCAIILFKDIVTMGVLAVFQQFDTPTRQMLNGNLMLVACCVFYLAWWVIAFRPVGAVKGIKSGWLLIPAFVFGLIAVIWIVQGSGATDSGALLIPKSSLLVGGVVAYVLLFGLTGLLMHRQVTTELFLIVGWAVLTCLELDALFAYGYYSRAVVIAMLIVTLVAAVVSLVCYLFYYELDGVKSYVDGMIPLVLASVMLVVITLSVVCLQ